MQRSILIRSVNLISEGKIRKADVYIKKGLIKTIGNNLSCKAEEIINAGKLFLLPGVIDTHVHFRDPGMEWKEDIVTGSRAAASGGVTTFFDMPNTVPPTIDRKTLSEKKKSAAVKSLVNYNFYIGATADNIRLIRSFKNIPGIKLFIGSSTGNLLIRDHKEIERLFQKTDKLITVHAEDEEVILQNKLRYKNSDNVLVHPEIRNEEAALRGLEKITELALKYKKRVHILHVSSKEEVNYLKKFKKNKLITCEVTPNHLFLSSPSVYRKYCNFAKVNPPIRNLKHQKILWQALKNGIIDCIGTDHAPHLKEEKNLPYKDAPSGMPSVELALPLMLNEVNRKKCSLTDIIKWLCENPAKIFNIKGKGFIKEGYDADLVLVDMNKSRRIRNNFLNTKAGWSVYEGKNLKGWPVMTIVNGNIVWREGKFFTDYKGKEVKFHQSGK